MNLGYVRYIMGRILLLEAALLCPSLALSLYDREVWATTRAIILSIAVLVVLGGLLGFKKPARISFYAREGFVIVALTWILLSLFGALPFYLSGAISSPINAFFETASGFTTTGASILNNIEALPRSLLFWRSLTHLVGGMGILVFVLAIMPRVESDAVHIMKAEVPGPAFGKLLARVSHSARTLYIIYLAMTAVLVVLLRFGGMPIFDSFLHAFGAAGTGGFSLKNASIGFYDSAYIEGVLSVAMILFGINFNLYYLLLLRQVKIVLKNEELRWFIGIIVTAFTAICIILWPSYESVGRLVRDVLFTVSSIVTTTGYSTVDFNTWPLAAHIIIILLMFCGAMSGSTGGGLKISRVIILVKTSLMEISQSISPHRRVPLRLENKVVDNQFQRSVSFYFTSYFMFFVLCLIVVSFSVPNFTSAFTAVTATINNIGPGLDVVGPTGNYESLNPLSKLVLSFAMIAGRLEIFPILILFSPKTWRRT